MNDWILVIDDDAANLRLASRILTAENMRVSCLKSGQSALTFLEGNRPDLILLDIHMPGMDGFETCAAIRGNTNTADIPVIFLTADDDSETETRGLKAGAMDFIKKPFESASSSIAFSSSPSSGAVSAVVRLRFSTCSR